MSEYSRPIGPRNRVTKAMVIKRFGLEDSPPKKVPRLEEGEKPCSPKPTVSYEEMMRRLNPTPPPSPPSPPPTIAACPTVATCPHNWVDKGESLSFEDTCDTQWVVPDTPDRATPIEQRIKFFSPIY